MNFLKSLFQGPEGDMSSKRTVAIVWAVCGVIYLFITKDSVGAGVLIGAAGALLGVSAITGK